MRFTLLFTLALFTGSLCAQVFTKVQHLGREHLKIETRVATYLYDPIAGGFSSVIDVTGKDWVAYRDTPWGEYPASAASSFRGVPNLVYKGEDDGAGHPGHGKCSSRLLENRIETETISGKWAWTWTFFPDYAKLEVTKADPDRAYWFLYEGPAGGKYQPKTTVWGNDLDGPLFSRFDHYRGSKYSGLHQWMYFTTLSAATTFWMACGEQDTDLDQYSLLGNETIGADSKDGMVVAAFGRTEPAEPLLTGLRRFYIGFYPRPVLKKKQHRNIGRFIKRRLKQ